MFYFGVDYYPEHWPEERWLQDARLMAEAGFTVVRLAEFAWSKMEPQEGHYDFEWLDRALALLSAHGLRAVLGTPTASPPPWLMVKHPELFRVRDDGRAWTYGNRREYCPNNPVYHDYTRRIVTAMAQHYADHAAVIGWQIDNEFGDRCYCTLCARAFQQWLRQRYGTLAKLNEQWGTVFWSHVYNDWSEIPLPLTTCRSPNPGLALDFYRFCSDSYVAYQQMQIDILRQQCPKHFITHNLMGFGYDRLDYFDLASALDVVSWDNYPRTQWRMEARLDPAVAALSADAMRGLLGKNVWVMEQQAGPGGWEMVSVMPRPGELRLWAYQAIAHGADAIVFFRWRTALFGTEEYWHGLLSHDGRPTRRYEEIKRMGTEIRRAGDAIHGAVIRAQVAIIQCYDSRFAFQIQANNPQFSYIEHVRQVYRAFFSRNVPVDVVSPMTDLSRYKLVVAPALHILPPTVAENLRRYVESGGILVLTPRTGVKNEANAVVTMPLPGLLADVCGVTVEDYDSLPPGAGQPLTWLASGINPAQPVLARIWCDILALQGAQAVASYTQDYYAGQAAVAVNSFGKGQAVYVGTFGDDALYDALAPWVLNLAGVRGITTTPPDIEVSERWQGDKRILFVLNHSDQPKEAALRRTYTNLLDGRTLQGKTRIEAHDVLVLTESV